tara:strand:+ start:188 stop:361 length:174 start_codon:yes stop_codon:yes gene_type:complete
MPTFFHPDNGAVKVVHRDNCDFCFNDTYEFQENDVFAWEICTNCGHETEPEEIETAQ